MFFCFFLLIGFEILNKDAFEDIEKCFPPTFIHIMKQYTTEWRQIPP